MGTQSTNQQLDALANTAAAAARSVIDEASDPRDLAALESFLRRVYPDDPAAEALVQQIHARRRRLGDS